jgi:co-chaperonin GroES (HSP10)
MKIKPKKNILLLKKHEKTAAIKNSKIILDNNDADKRLITGTVLSDNSTEYKKGETIIFGKYALNQLTVEGQDYFLINEEDILGTCDYKE